MFLIFDTETTGLPARYNAPVEDVNNWPRLVQLAWQIFDGRGSLISATSFIVKPEGFTIPFAARKIHGISTERAMEEGMELASVLRLFAAALVGTKLVVGHNVDFDLKIVGAEFVRTGIQSALFEIPSFCTKEGSTDFCAIPGGKEGRYKWPTLAELHQNLFHEGFEEAHQADADVAATARCFLELIRRDIIGSETLPVTAQMLHEFRLEHPDPIPSIHARNRTEEKLAADHKAEDTELSEALAGSVPEQEATLDSNAKPGSEPETFQNPEPEPGTAPETVRNLKPGTETSPNKESEAEPTSETHPNPEPDPEPVAVRYLNPEFETDPEPEADPATETHLNPEPEADPETETYLNPEPEANPETESYVDPESGAPSAGNGFIHLHLHTRYSILDGASDIRLLMEKAHNDGMTAVAITDHGNMFGVKEFHNVAVKKGIKPIIGCEAYVARRTRHEKSDKLDGGGFHLVLLAKDKQGYQNLIKLISYGWTEGFYYKPRIDKELLREYREGLIALSACLHGEVPYLLIHEDMAAARTAALEYREIFGEDFYFELQRHPSGNPQIDREVYENQVYVNRHLLELSHETGIKCVATNDVHFINREDAQAHDRLLCISTGKDIDDPTRMQYTHQEWMKTQQEMKELFKDLPEAIRTTQEISGKIGHYGLNSEPVMPDFPIPEGFADADEYLHFLTYEGAAHRYPHLDEMIRERIDFELETISKMGYPGYFLIVWDVIRAAREMDVSVGPGRGSAAGSVVAYCLKITDIDPIKYDLLFERFLNPDRISMPDIDIDFDEDGREKVLQYVVKKYGEKRVAHVITFGTMAPKMAIRDVARVQKLALSEADRLAKLIPDTPGTSFKESYEKVPALLEERSSPNELIATTLKYAEVLEGSVRQSGVHACGIIIGRDNLEEYIPICRSKDAELNVTQYEGSHIESVGMLKMDFLGLKTLSIIRDCVENIRISRHIDLDIDAIPLEDTETFDLYSRGETTGLFQFESEGMKKYLKALKPNRFEDLIAMNALYRPGPMEYIPSYINRKNGKEEITYDIPEMEAYLKDTYGITVYQEQVMLLSQLLAGFSKGEADSLRKAMGKKIASMMGELQVKFEEGCVSNGHEPRTVRKIWKDWESFAQYAFNKSHSTCYAYISYQTAYLKAHYPAEFMAAVLSRNINDIKKIGFFMDECRRMGMKVLVPDVNESYARFTVNTEGHIRFGMAAIKGMGESAVEHIIEVRKKGGLFKDVYDLVERVNLTMVNKRCIEALAMSGGLDSFQGIRRYEYFEGQDNNGQAFIEQLLRYGNRVQSQSDSAPTLFGNMDAIEVVRPKPSASEEWSPLVTLNKEKEVIGIYLSAHPLDHFKLEMTQFCDVSLSELRDLATMRDRELTVAGMVTQVKHATTKNGKPYGSFTIEDYTDSYNTALFGKDYENFRKFMYEGYSLLLKGTVQENTWKKPTELEFRIKSMHMLSSVREELIHNLQVRIPLHGLTQKLLTDMKEFMDNGKGNTDMRFLVYDPDENVSIEMYSRYRKVSLTDELLSYLSGNSELEFKLY